uniref:ubiquitinyl hydrolase 1 n=1 Tax=Aceria tosichella TaxID=561515 RepID=A0A6G1SE33_9ACAR
MTEHSYDHHGDRPSLSMDERIVWISDNGPEYGNVRWLGKLPDLGKEWMAGVEFDNPVGSGTGLYKDRQLFVTPLNHASLVPVIGLLKASDFDGPHEPPPPPSRSGSSGSRLIVFNDSPSPPMLHDDIESRYIESLSASNQRNDDRLNLIDTYSLFQHDQMEQFGRDDAYTHHHRQQALKQSHSRVRHIPIMLERDKKSNEHKSISMLQSHLARQPPSKVTNDNIQQSTNRSSSRSYTNHQDITSAMKQLGLNDRGRTSYGVSRSLQSSPSLPPPALVVTPDDKNPALTLENLLGKSRGIQGHNNSCYLDATLFAMYSSTTLFDPLLLRPANQDDISEYQEIQRILREDIVRPLRTEYFVSADQVMVFRTMLERSSSVEGLTDEEKDPEEFLSLLLGQILKAEPYLKLSSGLESFFYQLIVDKDENVILPTVQDLFHQSFVGGTVRLRDIPPCLLMQMPRFGRQYKMYSRIMPSLRLDITDVLESAPRSCGHRGKGCDNLARYECKDCLHERPSASNTKLSSATYCHNCFQSKHFGKSHITGIEDHDKTKKLLNMMSNDAITKYSNKLSKKKHREIPRIYMELFAVLCIETSHYVCFVKCGPGPDAPWCFFDSMADRKGEQDGYNIPEVLLFDEFAFWTSDNGVSYLLNHRDDKLLPEMARRLICDAYLCFYQYNELTTYR